MLRKVFMQKNISAWDLHHVIGHNASVYFKVILRTILILFVLAIAYMIISWYSDFKYLSRIFWILWIWVFIKFVLDFLNRYLDWLALSSSWLTLFMWEWLLEYKTEYFDWGKIATISHNQNWFWDKVLWKWDIILYVEHDIQFPFENVTSPKKQVDKIMRLKNYYSIKKNQEAEMHNETEKVNEDQKLNILVDALSEVVKEYIDKKDTKLDSEWQKLDFF